MDKQSSGQAPPALWSNVPEKRTDIQEFSRVLMQAELFLLQIPNVFAKIIEDWYSRVPNNWEGVGVIRGQQKFENLRNWELG